MINLCLTNVCVSSHSYRHDWRLSIVSFSLYSVCPSFVTLVLQLVTFFARFRPLCGYAYVSFRFLCFHLTDIPSACIASLLFIDMAIIINAFLLSKNFVGRLGLEAFSLSPSFPLSFFLGLCDNSGEEFINCQL